MSGAIRTKSKTHRNFSSWILDTYGYEHDYAMEGYGVVNYHVDVTKEHDAKTRDSAAKGTVILKNNGALPLTGNERLTIVFGSDAGPNLYGPSGCADRGMSQCTIRASKCLSANNIDRL
jgi:beta-glucosidase